MSPRRLLLPLMLMLSTTYSTFARANVVGADAQNFNPTTDGLDFVTVQSSETLRPGVLNFGFFVNHAVNALPRFETTGTKATGKQTRIKFNDTLTGADLNVGVGITDFLAAGLSFPHIILQEVKNEDNSGHFGARGNTEVRANAKVRMFGDASHGMALIGSMNFDRTKNNPYTGKSPKPAFNLELAGDFRLAQWAIGANLGFRWRRPSEPITVDAPIQPLDDQMIASAAASYHLAAIDTKVIFELFGSRPAKGEDDETNRRLSSAEALLGAKHDLLDRLALHAGAGTELFHGRSSPDWRIYVGANYALGGETATTTVAAPVAAGSVAPPPTPVDRPFVGPPRPKETFVVQNIIFEFDTVQIVNEAGDKLIGELAAYLGKAPVFSKLVIIGHTDSMGSAEYNLKLSERRAAAIKTILVETHKVDGSKIEVIGIGEAEPLDDNGNYQGRQMNRRVEFVITRNVTGK